MSTDAINKLDNSEETALGMLIEQYSNNQNQDKYKKMSFILISKGAQCYEEHHVGLAREFSIEYIRECVAKFSDMLPTKTQEEALVESKLQEALLNINSYIVNCTLKGHEKEETISLTTLLR